MAKNHLKQINAPKTWPITRKDEVFTLRPRPSGHPSNLSMPLSILLKNELQLAKTLRQIKSILHTQELLVNGKKKYKPGDTAGLFDVVTFPSTKTSYRVLINRKNRLYALPIGGDETGIIPSKVVRKTPVAGGKLQLCFHNGRTLLVDPKKAPAMNATLFLTPKNSIKETCLLEEGAAVLIIGGGHVGKEGVVKSFEKEGVQVDCGGEMISTRRELLFALGKGKPSIKVSPKHD